MKYAFKILQPFDEELLILYRFKSLSDRNINIQKWGFNNPKSMVGAEVVWESKPRTDELWVKEKIISGDSILDERGVINFIFLYF